MANRRSYVAAAAVGGLAAGTLIMIGGSPAFSAEAGGITVWGVTAGESESFPAGASGYVDVASGAADNVYAIDGERKVKRLKGSNANLALPTGLEAVDVVSVSVFGSDSGGMAALLTEDGVLHTWGSSRGLGAQTIAVSSWGASAGAKPVDVAVGNNIALVRFDNGQVGMLSKGFGVELVKGADGVALAGVTDIAAASSAGAVLDDGVVANVSTSGVGLQAVGPAEDPIIDIDDSGQLAVAQSGAVWVLGSGGAWVQQTLPPHDGRIVQVAADGASQTSGVARTSEGDVVAWPASVTRLAPPASIQGKVIDLRGGATFQVLTEVVHATAAPTIAGTPTSGQTLTGTAATFSAGAGDVTSVWKNADTEAVLGSTDKLDLTDEMIGTKIVYVSTAKVEGEADVVSRSAVVGPVAAKAPAVQASAVSVKAAATSYGRAATVTVNVTSGGTVGGSVAVTVDGKAVGSAPLAGGAATLRLPATLAAGRHTVAATYAGTATTAKASGSVVLSVSKATSSVKVALPKKVKKGKKATIKVTVTAPAGAATGTVKVKVGSAKAVNGTIKGGKATVKVKVKAKKPGRVKVSATWSGNANVAGSSATAKLKVVK